MAETVKSQRPPVPSPSGSGPAAPVKIAVAVVAGLVLLCVALTLILIGPAKGFASGTGLFGTRASLFADLNLLAEIVLLLGLTVGYGLAKGNKIAAHQYNQTVWVLLNIVLVMFIMIISFSRQVVRGIPAELLKAYYFTSFLHSLLGGITILCGIYILLRMNKLLPPALRISWWKNLMRITLGLYWLVGLFGLGTYYVWYVQPRAVADVPEGTEAPPNTVIVPVANYAFNPGVLEIPAGTTVIFRNDDPDPHTVTSETDAFPEGQLEEKSEYSFTFTTEGEFPYFCLYHGAAGGVGMAGLVKVVPAGSIAALPTAVNPPEPTAQPTAAEPPADALGAQSVGYGAFRDSAARSDAFELVISGLPAPQGEFHAWLIGEGSPLHLGPVSPDAAGNAALTYVSPTGENLLAKYNGFSVTQETAGSNPTAPSGSVLVTNSLAPEALGPVRQLLVASSDAPAQTPYAVGLITLSEELFRHAKAVNGATILGDTAGQNRHIEHMLTIIEGQGGEHYTDFDHDGAIQDPGDGFGILHYTDGVAAQAAAAVTAAGASDNVRIHAAEVQVLATNLRTWAGDIVDLVLVIQTSTDPAAKQAAAARALELSRNMLNGVDANANGVIEATVGEGGAYTAYFYAQYLAALGAEPEPGSGIATPLPPTGTPEPTAEPSATATLEPGATAAPTATPAPATATPEPTTAPTAAPVFITYRNFEIVPAQTTIKVGTTVTFLIQGALHQPYNFTAPNTFESPANLGDGTSYSFTFNEAGTVTILCGYHANMSATVIVQP